jgi:transcriptional regulator
MLLRDEQDYTQDILPLTNNRVILKAKAPLRGNSLRLKADNLVKEIIKSSEKQRAQMLEKYSRARVNNTSLTVEEVLVLYMRYVEKNRPEDIARKLNKSRSNIYAALQRVKDKLKMANETAKFIEALTEAVCVDVRSGEDADVTIRRIYSEADKLKVKLPLKSYDLKEKLKSDGLIDEFGRIKIDARIIVLPGVGIYHSP